MSTSKYLWAVVIALACLFASCDWITDEPIIEGGKEKFFSSQAQRKSFRVINASGKPYNHKIDWEIVGIMVPYSHTFLTKKVDTLSNGDLQISYDWVSFTVRENKSVIDVEVQKNETGERRSVHLQTSSYKQRVLPDIMVIQRAE